MAKSRKPPIEKIGTRRLIAAIKLDIRKLLTRKK